MTRNQAMSDGKNYFDVIEEIGKSLPGIWLGDGSIP